MKYRQTADDTPSVPLAVHCPQSDVLDPHTQSPGRAVHGLWHLLRFREVIGELTTAVHSPSGRVPQSDVPGEVTSLTQPFPVARQPLHQNNFPPRMPGGLQLQIAKPAVARFDAFATKTSSLRQVFTARWRCLVILVA
jgi:hypothetical protein